MSSLGRTKGRPDWDCKGFSALKIDALERAGVTRLTSSVPIVPGAPLHMVVQVRLDGQDYVLDETPWLETAVKLPDHRQ